MLMELEAGPQNVRSAQWQVVNGKRAPNGFSGRALPHFPRGDRSPEGKGFVAASFYRCGPACAAIQQGNLQHYSAFQSADQSASALQRRKGVVARKFRYGAPQHELLILVNASSSQRPNWR